MIGQKVGLSCTEKGKNIDFISVFFSNKFFMVNGLRKPFLLKVNNKIFKKLKNLYLFPHFKKIFNEKLASL